MTIIRGPTFLINLVLVMIVVLSGLAYAQPHREGPQEMTTVPVANAENSQECVPQRFFDRNVEDAYPTHFTITCERDSRTVPQDEGGTKIVNEVNFEMDGAWAYIVVIELPDDAPSEYGRFELNEAPNAPMQDDRFNDIEKSLPRQTKKWKNITDLTGDDSIVIVTSNWWTWDSTRNPHTVTRYEKENFGRTIDLHPGVYNVTLRAHLPHIAREDEANNVEIHTLRGLKDAAKRGPTREEEIRLQVGPCHEGFDAGPKLKELDRRELEALRTYGNAEREFAGAKSEGYFWAGSTAALTVLGAATVSTFGEGLVAGGASAKVVTAGTAAGGLGISELPLRAYDYVRSEALDGQRKALRKLATAREDRLRVYEERRNLYKKIKQCHGGGYQIPEDYQPLTGEDREAAKSGDCQVTELPSGHKTYTCK